MSFHLQRGHMYMKSTIFGILAIAMSIQMGCVFQHDSTDQGSPETTFNKDQRITNYDKLIWSQDRLISSPINLQISSDFSEDERAQIITMADQWDEIISDYKLFNFSPDNVANKNFTGLDSYYDGEMGIYKSYGWFNDIDSNVLAVTQYFTNIRNKGTAAEYYELIHADIIVNYKDFTFSVDNKDNGISYDLPSVLLHEFGHFLGLPHQTSNYVASVMQPYMSIFLSERYLYSSDMEAISLKYNGQLFKQSIKKSTIANIRGSLMKDDDDLPIRGIIELMADGKCRHYINGQLQINDSLHN